MILIDIADDRVDHSIPRMSGDDPKAKKPKMDGMEYSPHERG